MLKFQKEWNIDHKFNDLYKKVAPDFVKYRRNIDKAPLSDSEIITPTLCGELTPKTHDTPKSLQRMIFKARRRIESTFSQLTEQFNIEKNFWRTLCQIVIKGYCL